MNTDEIGSLFQFIRNGMNIKQDKSGAGLPITRIETISEGKIDGNRVGFAGLKESDCSDWLLRPNDILFSHINSVEHIGKCAIYQGVPEKLVHGMNLLCLRPELTKLHPGFAKYLLRGPDFRRQLTKYVKRAVNQASISIGDLKTIRVPLPSLAEQRRIADILDKADAIRRKRRTSIEVAEQLARAAYHDLFGDPQRNPKGLRTVPLDETCEIMTGFAFQSQHYQKTGGIRLCRGANVLPDALEWSDVRFWPQDDESLDERLHLRLGDVILAMDRPWISGGLKIARVSVADIPSLLVQRVARIRAISPITNEYLFYSLRHPAFARHCSSLFTETTIPHISPHDIRSFRVPYPEPLLIEQFTAIIRQAEQQLTTMRVANQHVECLFHSLVQRAFRGEL